MTGSSILNFRTGSFADTYSRYRIFWHILFWVWLYVLDVLIFGIAYQNVSNFVVYALVEMPGQIIFAYSIVYWILPTYFLQGRYGEALGLTIIIFLMIGLLGHGIAYIISRYPDTPYARENAWWSLSKIMLAAFYCVLKACIFIVIKLVMLWYDNERKVAEMEKTRLESELKMLKDQVNPHFMFNTLNNLYGLIGKNPLHAQESVLGFSGILRYMLYDSNQRTVSVDTELKCILNYIELEKLRYPGNLSVSVNVQEEVRWLSIVPLSIFPFVENSFKHGAAEHLRDAWINIDFSVYRDDFIFKIENSKGRHTNGSSQHGIGLKNVKRRLELLYNNRHRLQVVDGDETFLVILKITLEVMKKQNHEQHEGEMSYRGG